VLVMSDFVLLTLDDVKVCLASLDDVKSDFVLPHGMTSVL
jgi:hypothetical protein